MSSLWDDIVGIYGPLLCLLLVGLSWLIYWPAWVIRRIGYGILRAGEWLDWRSMRLRWWAEERAGR